MIGPSLRAFAVRVFAAMVGGRAFLLVLVFVFTAGTQAIAQTMTAPDITSEEPFLVDEGATAVATLTADDSDTTAGDLIWSKTGGADSGKFGLTSAGVLTFSSVKDYEAPDDADADGTYEVTVQVSDGTDSDMAALLVTLRNVTELTAITGPSSVAFPENSWSRVAAFTASSEEDRAGIDWVLAGTDSDHFSIDSPSGALRFALQAVAPRIFSEPPDFEAPVDPDAANTYELTLLARAGSSVTDTHTFTVTVTDVDEEGALSLSSTRPALGAVLTAVPTDPDGVTAGTALWQWERSTGRNSWAVIDGAASASYTPAAADTNTFLRVTATYADEHGTGKTVSEVAPNVVTGPLLTGLTVEADDSRVDTVRGLYPAFDPQTLHYRIGCAGANALLLTVSAPAHARLAVAVVHPPLPEPLQPPKHARLEAAGVQAARAPEVVSVPVAADSDVTIRVADASGAGTTYVVHCLPDVLFRIETHAFPDTEAFEDLILFNHDDYFRLMDRNGVPRQHLRFEGVSLSATRFHRVGADGAYRYGFALGREGGYTILDEDFEAVAEGVRTAAPLTGLDHHDFQILEDGNYLLMSYEPATRDFSDIDLPYLDGADVSSVAVRDAAFQIVTPGRLAVFTWKSWNHMAVEDCVAGHFPVALSTDPNMRELNGDYAHINGAHVVDSVLVASMRGCSKVLGIDVEPGDTRGDVLWRMGRTNLSGSQWAARDIGPRPLDFINDPEGEFCGQHAARFLPNGNVFLFDNGVVCAMDPWAFDELGREGSDFSRAVEYALDLDNHEAVFVRDLSLRGERSHLGEFTGNVDVLDNGDWLVSWGGIFREGVEFPNNEMATLVDPATGQEKLGIRFRELPTSFRQRLINATVVPSEALAPQPVSLTAEFPASDHTSLVHTGAGDASQVIVSFNQPVVDFSASSPSISVQGATIESVLSHIVAGEPANAYVVTLTPAGTSDITVVLVADQPCADGGICTAGETLLSEVPASHVIRADTTPPTVSNIEVSSDPGTDRTYAAGDEIQVTVTFSETVEVTGTPQLTLELGGGQRTGTYEGGSGTAALVFGYTVAAGESDTDGVGVEADSLSGGTIRDGAGHNAVLEHEAVTPQAGHKVDGVKPELAASGGAVVNGTTLTLTYDEALDGSSTPATGDFTVSGGDQVRTVTGVRVNGSAVELTLDVGAEHLEAGIQVSYTPGDNPIQDVPGNEAETLSRETVDNETPDTTAPTVSSLAITSSPGSDQTYAAGEEIELTVTFSEAVEVEGTPQLRLRVGTRNRTAGYDSGTGTASLVFAYEVADGDEDTGGVSIEAGRIALNGGTIEDEADNDAVLDHEAVAPQVEHKVDGARPALAATGGAVVDGTTLTLTYDESLDGSSTPVPGDFTVSGGDQVRTVTGVRVNGSAVELTLDVGAEHLEAGIQVSYTPGDNPIQDAAGNDALGLSNERVTNNTGDTTAPTVSSLAITSSPGSDQTYAAGEEIELTVTFSEAVEVEGTPQLRLRVGTRNRTAGYDSGTGTASLVFAYEVADGDEDTGGVSIEAGRIALNGGTIEDAANNPAELAHESVATQAGHKVDGVRPAFVSAAVDGASLTLTYGEALDGGSRPAPGDFTVQVGGTGRSVSGVSISDAVVTLTLNPEVEHGDTGIRVSYTPGTNPLRDAVGNDALGLSNRSVTNTTGAPNTAPQITSPSSFDVPENQTVARRLAARDTDPGDEVTGWAIVGGTDRGQFTITSDTGDLSFRTLPDFEAPGDNEYEVTVEVRSGVGARELEAEQTFTLRVTDERESPGIPEAPTFSGETADSLTVNWSEPDNTGPAITDYDVQYREKGTGRFTDGQHEGPGLSLTLDDLEPGTIYEVQVRATNDEGRSDWSESGEGITVVPLTFQMTSDLPPPVEGPFTVRFSYSEPVTDFSSNDIESGQNPACSDDQNNPVFCDPGIGRLDTVDNRVFTATVTPGTDGVAHNYTLTLTVSGGAVRSSAGNKPNEEGLLEVRVAPPGVTVPISSLGLTASAGNAEVRLSWNRPTENGGSTIIRYEYRFAAASEDFSAWEDVSAGTRRVTVGGLIDGREYVFETRAVNALGKGGVETVMATPEQRVSPPRPPTTGGGGGSGRGRPPSYPGTIQAEGGDGEVTLTWDAPSSQGSSRIQHYEYRIDGEGEWISTGSTDRIHTITGLTNGRVYFFHLRAVSAAGAGSHRISPEATPVADLDFTHFTNGGFVTSTLVLVNAGAYPVRPAIYFYDQDGDPIAARSLVSLTPDLEVGDDGALSPRTVMNPLGELTIATHGRGGQRVGSVTVRAASSIGGVLRFDIPGFGVAGVGDSPTIRDALVPVRRQDGGINTGVAVRNRGTATLTLQCRLMRDGAVLEETDIRLEVNGQDSRFIDAIFPVADTSDFAGSVRCTAPEPGLFSAVAFELDGVNRIFTTLPVVPVPAVPEQEQQEEEQDPEPEQESEPARLDFTHFANGGDIVSDLVLVNPGADPIWPAIYFYDQAGDPIAAESLVDITEDLEVGDDGALSPRTAINPLGELTISTDGRGGQVSGSVAVAAEGPIGGVLRFDIPALGVAGVGDSPPVRDALVPVRRLEGGINTGVALHNRGATAILVRCRLMRDGIVLDETMIPLAANGQDARFIDAIFPTADTSDFVGSGRCLTPEPGLFSAVAFELDGVHRIFTTLPVVPVVEVP